MTESAKDSGHYPIDGSVKDAELGRVKIGIIVKLFRYPPCGNPQPPRLLWTALREYDCKKYLGVS